MIHNELIGQVPENTAEAVAHWRDFRVAIHDAFEQARSPEQRATLLALNRSVMGMAEQGIDPKYLETFREIRGHSYSMLVAMECIVDGQVCAKTADAVIRRELASGRMAPNHGLRDLKQMQAFAAHLMRTRALTQQLTRKESGPVNRVLSWLLQ